MTIVGSLGPGERVRLFNASTKKEKGATATSRTWQRPGVNMLFLSYISASSPILRRLQSSIVRVRLFNARAGGEFLNIARQHRENLDDSDPCHNWEENIEQKFFWDMGTYVNFCMFFIVGIVSGVLNRHSAVNREAGCYPRPDRLSEKKHPETRLF